MPSRLGATYPQQPTFFGPRYIQTALGDGTWNQAAIAINNAVTNLAYYEPIIFETSVLITSFAWLNGSSIGLNVDVGLYTFDGTRLGNTTSTAQVGTSAMQTAAPSGGNIVAGPGVYYLAIQFSSNTANTVTCVVMTNAEHPRVMGVLQQAVGSFGLPATATFAQSAQVNLPVIGVVAEALSSDWRAVTPIALTPYSFHADGLNINIQGGGPVLRGSASAVWPTANRALYYPIWIPSRATIAKAFVQAGATSVNTNHFDIGLYAEDGTKVFSTGSTTWSGTINVLNVVDITDTVVPAGLYYLALAVDTGTDTVFRIAPATLMGCQISGYRQQASAFALPATATFAVIATAIVPVFGFTQAATL